MGKSMSDETGGLKKLRTIACAGVATALVALACTAGMDTASAASKSATSDKANAVAASAAVDVENGSANTVAFHKEMGIDFAKIAADAQADLTETSTAAEKSAAVVGTREFCLSCHDWDQIVDSTVLPGDVTVYNKQGMYNVHDNHNGEVNCSDCHSVVEETPSRLVCVRCHYMEIPAGWNGFE